MTLAGKPYDGIKSVAVIGNYLPRQCGIATFTMDLVEGMSAEAPDINCWTVAMNDRPEGYPYPEKVRFEINQNKLSDYSIFCLGFFDGRRLKFLLFFAWNTVPTFMTPSLRLREPALFLWSEALGPQTGTPSHARCRHLP